MHKLLAVVEVDKDSRVICQFEGCGRHVYKRIHVVLDNEKVSVLGQRCYSKMYHDGSESITVPSHYTGAESRKLTAEEIAMLIDNTAWLIEQFEYELMMRLEKEKEARESQERLAADEERKRLAQIAANQQSQNEVLHRDVVCHYCKRPMKTRAKSVPAVGYKCQACIENNRSLPSRMGVTAEMNARDNDEVERARSHRSSADDYRNTRG